MRSSDVFDYEEEDVDYFVEKLKTINPDVVCLQETHMNATRSVAKEIALKLGGYFCFDIELSPSHIDREYRLGNAILSRNKPTAEESFIFPYPNFPLVLPGGEPAEKHNKGFQIAHFPFGSVMNFQMMPLGFLGTPYESNNGTKFAHEMEKQLLKHITSPAILFGDFNTPNVESLYKNLIEKINIKNALPDNPTRPNGKRSDYILFSNEFSLVEAGIIETKTDHYLCWAKFE